MVSLEKNDEKKELIRFGLSAILIFGIIFSLYKASFYVLLGDICFAILVWLWWPEIKALKKKPTASA